MRFKRFCFAVICILACNTFVVADDLEFDSFEAAEKAAQVRSSDYDKKMNEHLKNVEDSWEKQQSDIGENETPDVSKISENSNSTTTSDNEAAKNMDNAVNDSINQLKNTMVNQATPGTTGFAGGAAGYQWSIKFKDGKYVLSDSYSEADFNTGKTKEVKTTTPAPTSTTIAKVAPATKPAASTDSKSTTTSPTTPNSASPSTPSTTGAESSPTTSSPTDSSSIKAKTPTKTSTSPDSSDKTASAPKPKLDIAPTELPPPAVRMVIQHPTDFSEEVFASNLSGSNSEKYKLKKFKIPEDTRIKIAVEVDESINPEEISLVITDEEGERNPVSSTKMKNYRHMFRVPSEDKYSAKVIYKENIPGGTSRNLMEVSIPVIKVDFDSRTIDSKNKTQRSGNDSSMQLTSSAGASSSSGNYKHSSFGNSEQVDLSDLYSKPGSESSNNNTSNSQMPANDSAQSSDQQSYHNNNDYSSSQSSESSSSDGNLSAAGQTRNSGNSGNSGSKAGTNNHSGNSNDSISNSETGPNGYSENFSGASNNLNTNQEQDENSSDNSPSSYYSGGQQNNASDYPADNSYSATSGNTYSETTSDRQDRGNYYGNPDEEQYDDENYANGSANQTASNNVVESQNNVQQQNGSSETINSTADNSKDKNFFIAALSVQAPSENIYQSFDFIDTPNPELGKIAKDTELNVSLNFAKNVNRETVQIEIYDGISKSSGNLVKMGDSFAHKFKQPTNSAYISVSGNTDEKRFSYILKIAVK